MCVMLQVNGPFSVGGVSGVIHLTGTLDHNTNPIYTITVRAQVGECGPNDARLFNIIIEQ